MRAFAVVRVLVLWVFVGSSVASARSPRTELDLSGTWQLQEASELGTPPTSGRWLSIEVPGTIRGFDYERAWFRRQFMLPESMRGKRIKIQFDGVKFNSRVYVNGHHVGGCLNGYDAFEVDVTEAVRFGGPNQLDVGCHDWTGVFSEGKFDFGKKPDWQRPRRYVEDKVIAPIGGLYDLFGIWGDVTLVAHDEVHVRDLFIKPSVRRRELVIDYTVANESAKPVEVRLQAVVEDQGKDVLSLPPATLNIPPGESITKTFKARWADPHYWSHEDPYLYHVRSELSTGDRLRTRFGFREFWIEGHRYVLNGSKINLLASSWWPPPQPMEREEITTRLLALKAAGVKCFRTHTQPWRRVHYDVADEVGLLMIIEGPVWHDPYCTAYHDKRFWDNYARSIKAMLDREKNRPSVVMWSMGNELYSGEEKTRLAVEGLARIGQQAKVWDPTRPVYFESDGDPKGVADAIGMHYVHEYPRYTCWPNEAYWLEKPFNPKTWFGIESEPTVWKKEKPLYIGEFLWVPSGTPAPHTVFFGDEAYRDLDLYTAKGKGEAWKMQVLAFRHHEAGGMCPWTVTEGGDLDENNPLYRAHMHAYQPVAAYCHDYDRRFYAGRTVSRRVEVFNDTLSDSQLGFSWTLSHAGQAIAREGHQLSLAAGTKQLLTVELPMPDVATRSQLQWRLMIERDGQTVFDQTHRYSVFPPLRLPNVSPRLGLYDPSGATAELMTRQGVEFVLVDALEDIDPSLELVVIGDAVFQSPAEASGQPTIPVVGRIDPRRAALIDLLTRGGRILVLRQDAYPEGLFDVQPAPHQSTMTFPTRPNHRALEGVQADDLKFWRGDHMVTDHELPRPAIGATVPIVVSGSSTGIAYAPLLERPLGQGCLVHCQLKLVEKAETEPAAGMILGNLLQYLSAYKPIKRKTAVIGADQAYRESLLDLGLRFDDLGEADEVDLAAYSSVICRGRVTGGVTLARRLGRFVQQGGNLLVHRPTPETMELVRQAVRTELVAQPLQGSVRRRAGQDPMLEVIAREDLYWSIKKPGLSWARQPLSGDMIDGVVVRQYDSSGAMGHEIETWKLSGQYVDSIDPGVLFATNGTATGEIEFADSGRYGIGIRARGTPCRGVYPTAEISIDGKPLGSVSLNSDRWKDYGVYGQIDKGRHKVTVAFVNDASVPGKEDRNLEVDRVLVARDHGVDDAIPLTSPPAVVAQRRGEGQVVFDQIRWDTEQANGRKAARYACSLLTALEANFMPRSSITLECEQMTPKPDMPYYDADGSTAYMGSNGYIQATIQVAQGRKYAAELVASGDNSEGIGPLVEVRLGGDKLTEIQLTTEGWRSYRFDVELPAGDHELALWFVNDHYAPSGDRNLRLDKLMIYNPE